MTFNLLLINFIKLVQKLSLFALCLNRLERERLYKFV
jgi:hypothetical protein